MRNFEEANETDLFFVRVCGPEHFSWEVYCHGQSFARVSRPLGNSYRLAFTYFPPLYGDAWEIGENKSPDLDHEILKDRSEVLERLLSYWNRFITGSSRQST